MTRLRQIGSAVILSAVAASLWGAAPLPRAPPPAASRCDSRDGRVLVPAGTVLLGEDGEGRPGRRVAVPAFRIDRHAVTNRQFAAFVAATGYRAAAEREGGSAVFAPPKGPVNARRAAPRPPRAIRPAGPMMVRITPLPTAGVFPIRNASANGYAGLAPVGCFPANALGLHDMIGNVWEWTSEQRRGSGLIKGGSYLCAMNYCANFRPAAFQAQELDLGASHIGFRTISRAPDYR